VFERFGCEAAALEVGMSVYNTASEARA
jgi:hypothetical protein